MSVKVVAGVVSHNPDTKRLEENVNAVSAQAERTYIIDNGSENLADIKKAFAGKKTVKIISNGKNLGMAKALNMLLDLAEKDEAKYLLTLDQDSVLMDDAVNKMIARMGESVAIVCPTILDVNKDVSGESTKEAEELERCVTSGSLMNLTVCKKIGKFDEKMFIDYVDHDYCKRARLADYKIIRVNDAKMKHEVGKRTARKLLWVKVYPTNHSAQRVYYYVRNINYYLWKYYGKMVVKEKLWERAALCWKYWSIVLYENDKRLKLENYRAGRRDGKYGAKMGERKT